jgi:hypothetical protein
VNLFINRCGRFFNALKSKENMNIELCTHDYKNHDERIYRGHNISLEEGLNIRGPWSIDTSKLNLDPPRLGVAHLDALPFMVYIPLQKEKYSEVLACNHRLENGAQIILSVDPTKVLQQPINTVRELVAVA